jgi:hypothetical protein
VTGGGLTISRPRLSSVPLPILELTSPRQPTQIDPEDMRQATTRAGVRAWIVPGRRGICVAALDQASLPVLQRHATGAAEGCSGTFALAGSFGAGFSSCCTAGFSWHYGVLPNAHPILSIRTGPHSDKTIRPRDGLYIYRTRTRR